jgi:hypothetical protein
MHQSGSIVICTNYRQHLKKKKHNFHSKANCRFYLPILIAAVDIISMYKVICPRICRKCLAQVMVCSYKSPLIDKSECVSVYTCGDHIHDPNMVLYHRSRKGPKSSIHVHDVTKTPSGQRWDQLLVVVDPVSP